MNKISNVTRAAWHGTSVSCNGKIKGAIIHTNSCQGSPLNNNVYVTGLKGRGYTRGRQNTMKVSSSKARGPKAGRFSGIRHNFM